MCLSGATNYLTRPRLLQMRMNITANTYHANSKNIHNNTPSSSNVASTHAGPTNTTTTTTLPTSILRRSGARLTTPSSSSSTTPAVTVVHRKKVHWPHNLDQHKQVVKFDKVDAIAACDIGSPFEGDWYYLAQEDVFYDALDEMALDDNMHTAVTNVRDAVFSTGTDVEMEQQGNMEDVDYMDWDPVVHDVEGVCTMDWKPVGQEVEAVDCMDWEPVVQEVDDVDCMDWEPVGQEGVEDVDGMEWELMPSGEKKHFIADSIQSSFISLWSPAVSPLYSHAEVGYR